MMESPQERLQYYRETGQTDLAKEYEQYLRETGQLKAAPAARVPAAASDATRNAPRANRGGDLQAILSGGQGKVILDDVVPTLGAHAINAAQSIPFMRNVQAGALAATSPMNYSESLQSLDDLTSEIPGDMRAGEQIAAGALPWTKGISAAAPIVTRGARAAGAFAKELPFAKHIVRGTQKASRAWNATKPAAKIEAAAPKSLEDILGNIELAPEVEQAATRAPQTLEEAIEQTATKGKEWKPRSAPKARFEYFAERQAAHKAAQASPEIAEVPLEELLSLNLEHIKKGGSLKSASDALRLVRQK